MVTTLGNGSQEIFDAEWQEALKSGDERWLSFPDHNADTQAALFEVVKAHQIDAVLQQHGITSGQVLEYACGSAGMAISLAQCGFSSIALDASLSALRLAERNSFHRGTSFDCFSTTAGNVFHLPFADGTFDVVMSYGLLEHFTREELVPLLQETYRVLRPGGLHVVDIIHGRYSIRTLANCLNFTASACMHTIQRQHHRIPDLYQAYFANYYENTLKPKDYADLLGQSGLHHVQVSTCRPFPYLAISGIPERLYVQLLRALMPIWQTYDRTDIPLLDSIGWMYLAYGVKPSV